MLCFRQGAEGVKELLLKFGKPAIFSGLIFYVCFAEKIINRHGEIIGNFVYIRSGWCSYSIYPIFYCSLMYPKFFGEAILRHIIMFLHE